MKLIIFAGGIGTRLWPLSRQNSPKQFDKIFDGKSTIQLAVERIAPTFGIKNVYIQTVKKFKNQILEQLEELPSGNIFVEPDRRNLGPAVCYAMLKLREENYDGPVALLWADHLMEHPEVFTNALEAAESLIKENPNRFVFFGEKPRFANNNLGWINVGNKTGEDNSVEFFGFEGWKYKPEQKECDDMFKSGKWFWNPGYFITSVSFLLNQYESLAPDIYEVVSKGKYSKATATHFDRAIIEKVDLSNALVVKTDMGWSDPGTLYALKEALAEKEEDNITLGKVVVMDSEDALVYNLDSKKLVTAVGLKGMVVVNTEEALIVVPKEKVVQVTDLVKEIKKLGLEEYL